MSGAIFVERADPSEDRILESMFREDRNWIKLIKDLRAAYELTIYEAEHMALSHAGWRRWCEIRVNADPQCRKLALSHARTHGPDSLVERDGDLLKLHPASGDERRQGLS